MLSLSLPHRLHACQPIAASALESLAWSERLQVAEQAFTACPSFTAAYHYALSQLHLGQTQDALQTFSDYAYPLAQTPQERGLASLGMAQIFTELRDFCPAANHLLQAEQAGLKDSTDYQEVWFAYQQQRSQTLIKAKDIVCELQAKSSFTWRPRIDLPIHFEFDRADLNADGLQQTLELGRALVQMAQQPSGVAAFNLVGHTDELGTVQYNQTLSERRAATVQTVLGQYFPSLRHQLHSAGLGEIQRRSLGSSAVDHQINRRVEVEWVR